MYTVAGFDIYASWNLAVALRWLFLLLHQYQGEAKARRQSYRLSPYSHHRQRRHLLIASSAISGDLTNGKSDVRRIRRDHVKIRLKRGSGDSSSL